jgi:hypothetical protein
MKQDEEGARGRRDKPQNAVQRYTRVPGIAPKALQPFFFSRVACGQSNWIPSTLLGLFQAGSAETP